MARGWESKSVAEQIEDAELREAKRDLESPEERQRKERLDSLLLSKSRLLQQLERAKLPASLRLYDLRHSCATLLLAANENPKVVSKRLGHASITLTMDTYSHVLPDMQQSASDKLERMLFPKTGTQ